MFCYKCGNELPDSASFCNECGAHVGEGEEWRAPDEAVAAEPVSVEAPTNGATDNAANSAAAAPLPNAESTSQDGAPQMSQKRPNLIIIGVIAAVVIVFAVIAVMVSGTCSSNKSATSGNANQASSAASAGTKPSTSAAKHDHVTFAEITSMADVALGEALVDEGYKMTSNGTESIYKKGDREIRIDFTNGYRGLYLDSGSIDAVLKSEAPEYETFTVYKKTDAKDFTIAVCEVEGGPGLVTAAGKGAFICKPSHMVEAKKQIMDTAKIEYYMSAEEAAVEVAKALQAKGFKYAEGDAIYSGGSNGSSASTTASSSSTQNKPSPNAGTNTTPKTSSSYVGTWVDPNYGDTLAIDEGGRCNVLQDGKRSIWEWTETSNGIRITNVNGTYDFIYSNAGGKQVLSCDRMGLTFVKQ